MTMALHEDSESKQATPKARWLPRLEQILKSRIGWIDEAISPFTRHQPEAKAKPKIREAA